MTLRQSNYLYWNSFQEKIIYYRKLICFIDYLGFMIKRSSKQDSCMSLNFMKKKNFQQTLNYDNLNYKTQAPISASQIMIKLKGRSNTCVMNDNINLKPTSNFWCVFQCDIIVVISSDALKIIFYSYNFMSLVLVEIKPQIAHNFPTIFIEF